MSTVRRYRTNLNCGNCVAAVKPHLDSDPAIEHWSVDTNDPSKILTVQGENLADQKIKQHVADAGFQVLGEIIPESTPIELLPSSFWQTYKPLLLVLGYLIGIVGLIELRHESFVGMRAMANFMGGFFLAFSFFKLLNLRGFVGAFQSYDIVARPIRSYGYAYPFVELGLGASYVLGFAPVATNVVTLVVMLLGLVGVTQALLQKRTIQCACLGTVFNLPMSKVTFLEDSIMAAMAAAMLGYMLM
jgi:copper chaperone CopZ